MARGHVGGSKDSAHRVERALDLDRDLRHGGTGGVAINDLEAIRGRRSSRATRNQGFVAGLRRRYGTGRLTQKRHLVTGCRSSLRNTLNCRHGKVE